MPDDAENDGGCHIGHHDTSKDFGPDPLVPLVAKKSLALERSVLLLAIILWFVARKVCLSHSNVAFPFSCSMRSAGRISSDVVMLT
jgi:hypothetical protein